MWVTSPSNVTASFLPSKSSCKVDPAVAWLVNVLGDIEGVRRKNKSSNDLVVEESRLHHTQVLLTVHPKKKGKNVNVGTTVGLTARF